MHFVVYVENSRLVSQYSFQFELSRPIGTYKTIFFLELLLVKLSSFIYYIIHIYIKMYCFV